MSPQRDFIKLLGESPRKTPIVWVQVPLPIILSQVAQR